MDSPGPPRDKTVDAVVPLRECIFEETEYQQRDSMEHHLISLNLQ
jgi:hypothetical protein